MGNFRQVPESTKNTTKGDYEKIHYAASHMCGWRLYMEDSHITSIPFTQKKLGLFAVFDGHGGAQVAVFVEKYFAKELKANQNFKKEKYEDALRQTFLKMDQLLLADSGKSQIEKIQKLMRQKKNGSNIQEPSHAGCTANVVLVTPNFIYCANSGDSRAVASINKETVPLSEDHKPEDQVQINRITKAGGTVSYGRVNGNLNLSRALGDLQYKTNTKLSASQQIITANPDIKKIKNEKVDFIIMGCDGIWQVKSNQDMVKWVTKRLNEKKELSKITQELLDQLLAKDNSCEYGMDNMSVILINFDNKGK